MVKKKVEKTAVSAKHYDLVLKPVITEKATMGAQNNQVTFIVPLSATKPEIKEAVESVFKVKVKSVNTLRQKGKEKRFRGTIGQRSDVKKAIVALAEGSAIDFNANI